MTEPQRILWVPTWIFALVAALALLGLAATLFWMRAHKKVQSRVSLGLRKPVSGFSTSAEFMARLDEEVTRARSFGDPLGLMLIGTRDGSMPSDKVVAHVERVMRETDIIGPADVELLAVIAPRREIVDLIELRSTIEQTLAVDPRCQVEIGIAELEPYEDGPEDLWDHARSALSARGLALELTAA